MAKKKYFDIQGMLKTIDKIPLLIRRWQTGEMTNTELAQRYVSSLGGTLQYRTGCKSVIQPAGANGRRQQLSLNMIRN